MVREDRDRLVIGIGTALILHVLLFVGLSLAGWNFSAYPDTAPVYVTLPDYEPIQPQPKDEPEPEPVPQPEQKTVEPVPTATQPVPEVTAQPAPAPATPARTSASAAPRATAAATTSPAAAQPTNTDAPAGAIASQNTGLTNDAAEAQRAAEREANRGTSRDLFAVNEPDQPVTTLPSWVTAGVYSPQPESTLAATEQQSLQTKRETLPGFSEKLDALVAALNNPPSASSSVPGTTSGSTTGTPGSTSQDAPGSTSLPGGGQIDWTGSGTRTLVGSPTLPKLSASDFNDLVPARVAYLIVFDVDADGFVVPGSLILRQSSGYTLADQKVRAAISTWRFDRAPAGSPVVTAIATLQIARDQIR